MKTHRALLAIGAATIMAIAGAAASASPIAYRSVEVDGVKIAYRETGSAELPTVLLLHSVPSFSRMYDAPMRRLGDRHHMVAPDYPGFGNSDAPRPTALSTPSTTSPTRCIGSLPRWP